MDVWEVIQRRRSVRAFAPEEVEEVKLAQILTACNSAPSAGDLQSYEIVVVREPERRVALARAAHRQEFLVDAPLALVFIADPQRSAAQFADRGPLYATQDATISAAYAQLAAVALGLGTTWVGDFDAEQVRRAVGSSPEMVPVAIIPVGYPVDEPEKAPRRRLSDIVHHEAL